MKTTVNVYDFRDAFRKAERKNFSYYGLGILFDYLEEWESSTGEELELDVIALCCDFAEATHTEIAQNYGINLSEHDGDETAEHDAIVQYLENEGCYVGVTDLGYIIYRQH